MTWNSLGRHRYQLEGRLVRVTSGGGWSAEEVRELVALLEREQQREPGLGMLLDVANGISVGPASRRALAERTDKRGATVPVAVIGASLPVRAVLTMIIRTVQLFGGPAAPVAFFGSDGEALAWLAQYPFAGSGK